MGFFSKYVTSIYSTSTLILKDEALYPKGMPGIVRQSVGAAIVQNRNIATDLSTNLLNSTLIKGRSMYAYAASGGYVWGLPEGTTSVFSTATANDVALVIKLVVGGPIILISCDTSRRLDGIYYTAEYYLMDAKGEIVGELLTWEYNESTGLYPSLDIPVADETAKSPYYPIVPIRQDNIAIKDNPLDPRYITGKSCLRRLGINFDDLHKAIESNPDGSSEIDHAYVVIGVDIATQDPTGNEYLFDYFTKLKLTSALKEADYAYWEANQQGTMTPPMNQVTISDGNYRMDLGWSYINQTLVTGNIGKVNTFTKEITSWTTSVTVTTGPNSTTRDIYHNALIIRKQVSLTQYIELTVVNPIHLNYVYPKDIIRTDLKDAFGEEDDRNNFIIPVRIDIANAMGVIKAHDLMYDSVRLVFNSYVRTKLKWYQTGLFKLLILVVAVVVSIFNAPAGVALMSAAMAEIIISTIITTLVIGKMVEIAISALEDLLGEELALIIAVIATMFGYGKGFSYGNLIQAVNQGVAGVSSIYYTGKLESIQSELDTLEDSLGELDTEEAATAENLDFTMSYVQAGSYNRMLSSRFVRQSKLELNKDTLLVTESHLYTEMMRFTDLPPSDIKLGI